MRVVKLWQRRDDPARMCVMLQKAGVFDERSGRIATKLAMVYPDGRYQEAFGKIAVQNDWY